VTSAPLQTSVALGHTTKVHVFKNYEILIFKINNLAHWNALKSLCIRNYYFPVINPYPPHHSAAQWNVYPPPLWRTHWTWWTLVLLWWVGKRLRSATVGPSIGWSQGQSSKLKYSWET